MARSRFDAGPVRQAALSRRVPVIARVDVRPLRQERSITEVSELFDAEPMADDLGPRYNVAPPIPRIVVEGPGPAA
jgi:hypothetical protein